MMGLLFTLLQIFLSFVTVTVLYLISIKPRIHGRPDYRPFFGHMYAHRGLHNMNPAIEKLKSIKNTHAQQPETDRLPENSYAAIKRAADLGYGIEFDVHLTKDDVPVVFHDDTLNRICGVKGNLRDYTYAQLQQFRLLGTEERIPAFADILKMVDGRVPLIIEYKVEKNADKLCRICDRILSDYKGLYCIESFHPMAVRWYKIHRPNIVRGQLSEDFTRQKLNIPYFLLSHLIGNCYASPDFIAYNCKHKDELSRTICRKLYRSLSVAWTVRSQEELDRVSRSFDLFIFEGFVPARH
jgi:glycerophosphoryl diester phosphodiesterase